MARPAGPVAARVPLGIFVDAGFYVDGGTAAAARVSTPLPFMLFACEVGCRLGGFALFGRTTRDAGPRPVELPPGVRVVELPYYASLRDTGRLVRIAARTLVALWRGLGEVRAVWVFGPHPFGLLLVGMAALRGRPVVLGVRQDTRAYFRARGRGRRVRAILGGWLLDAAHRALARALPITVVGSALAARHGAPRRGVLAMRVLLMRAAEMAGAPLERDWSGRVHLLSVGRIEPEKNPELLIETMSLLERRHPGRFALTVAGSGALEGALGALAEQAGLGHAVRLAGHVPFGPRLLELYRSSHALVHVSLTEGLPQVILEALACGIPVVATDVGGVRAALLDGEAGLLVPPRDAPAVADAVERLAGDPALGLRLAARGLEAARPLALEAEAVRVADFIARATGLGPDRTPSGGPL